MDRSLTDESKEPKTEGTGLVVVIPKLSIKISNRTLSIYGIELYSIAVAVEQIELGH